MIINGFYVVYNPDLVDIVMSFDRQYYNASGVWYYTKYLISILGKNVRIDGTAYTAGVSLQHVVTYAYGSNATFTTIGADQLAEFLLNNMTSFHSDPVYVEATKLKYTDGTYNFARGNNTSDQARKKAYDYLLKAYGTFYRGTEEELASSFATELSDIKGGG